MSPRVELVFYPDGDDAFASHATIGLTIDVPPEYSATQVVAAVERHLRDLYPLARIRSVPGDGGDFDATWHVYRDGLPMDAT